MGRAPTPSCRTCTHSTRVLHPCRTYTAGGYAGPREMYAAPPANAVQLHPRCRLAPGSDHGAPCTGSGCPFWPWSRTRFKRCGWTRGAARSSPLSAASTPPPPPPIFASSSPSSASRSAPAALAQQQVSEPVTAKTGASLLYLDASLSWGARQDWVLTGNRPDLGRSLCCPGGGLARHDFPYADYLPVLMQPVPTHSQLILGVGCLWSSRRSRKPLEVSRRCPVLTHHVDVTSCTFLRSCVLCVYFECDVAQARWPKFYRTSSPPLSPTGHTHTRLPPVAEARILLLRDQLLPPPTVTCRTPPPASSSSNYPTSKNVLPPHPPHFHPH